MHPEFAPVVIIAALSLLLPLPWHWRARNIATLSIIVWLFVTNVIYAVDALVWANDADIVIRVWCDITTKIIIGSNVALPAACLCITMHLEHVASVRVAHASAKDKKRRQIFEALMCFGLPALFMTLHYIVQGHRFDIIEEYGCRPTTYISIPGIIIVYVPPLIMALATILFGALALRHFLKRRATFALHLSASGSALTASRYLRLMLMALAEMVTSIAFTAYTLYFTLMSVPMRSWTTWDDVHSDWSRIDSYYTIFTPKFVVNAYYILWWVVPISTFMFVAFFAFGKEAMDEYGRCFMWIRRKLFGRSSSEKSSKGAFGLLSFGPSGKAIIPISIKPPAISTSSTSPSLNQSPYKSPTPYKYQSRDAYTNPSGAISSRSPSCSPCHTDVDSSDNSSLAETYHVDLESHPLPNTPSTYAPTTPSVYIPPHTPATPNFSLPPMNWTTDAPLPPLPIARATTIPPSAAMDACLGQERVHALAENRAARPVSYPSFEACNRKVLLGGM